MTTKSQPRQKKNRNKKKKSNKRTPQATAPSSRFTTRPQRSVSRAPSSSIEAVCSLVDPFCNAAKGRKWPDGNGLSTIPYQSRGHYTLISTPVGGGMLDFQCTLPYGILASTQPFNNYTHAATLTAYNVGSIFITNCNKYRVVTAGLIIRNLAPALTTSGYLIITRKSSMPTLGSAEVQGSVYGTMCSTHPIVSGMEVPVIFKPLGSSARAFVPANTATSVEENWDVITIEVVGAPASTPLLGIEYVFNVEFDLNELGEGLAQLAPVDAPMNSLMVDVSNSTSTALSTLAKTSVETFTEAALAAAQKALRELLLSKASGRSKRLT